MYDARVQNSLSLDGNAMLINTQTHFRIVLKFTLYRFIDNNFFCLFGFLLLLLLLFSVVTVWGACDVNRYEDCVSVLPVNQSLQNFGSESELREFCR